MMVDVTVFAILP